MPAKISTYDTKNLIEKVVAVCAISNEDLSILRKKKNGK